MQKREEILEKIADAIDSRQSEILKENDADVKKAEEMEIDSNLMQRLGMKPQKLKNLTAGIRSIAKQSEPIRKVRSSLLRSPEGLFYLCEIVLKLPLIEVFQISSGGQVNGLLRMPDSVYMSALVIFPRCRLTECCIQRGL